MKRSSMKKDLSASATVIAKIIKQEMRKRLRRKRSTSVPENLNAPVWSALIESVAVAISETALAVMSKKLKYTK